MSTQLVGSQLFVDAMQRARAEYLEMPGLTLTAPQAARLWSVDAALCGCVLSALVESRFLAVTANASFVLSHRATAVGRS